MFNSVIKYEILCFTQTWFENRVENSVILNNEYTCYRSDRNLTLSEKETGGGVVLLIKNNLPSS